MKKLLAWMLALMMLLLSSVAFAAGEESSKAISFSGYEFGATFGEIRSIKRLTSLDYKYGPYNACTLADAFSYMLDRSGSISDGEVPSCFFARLKENQLVGGHKAETKLWCVFPVLDGAVQLSESDAIFYAGEYAFSSWENNLPSTHADLKKKLTTLYGTPYYAGADLKEAMGVPSMPDDVLDNYNGDVAKAELDYTVWKSQANGGMAVLCLWTINGEQSLKLVYLSNKADLHFHHMAEMGLFGEGNTPSTGMEGL